MKRFLTYLLFSASILLCLNAAVSCTKDDSGFSMRSGSSTQVNGERMPSPETRNVLLLYFAGRNDLYSWMKEDYADLLAGYIPQDRKSRTDNILLTYVQFPGDQGYGGDMESHLIRLSSDNAGAVICDTLRSYGNDIISASAGALRTVLTDVRDLFPAKGYGLIFSSHASGWLPAGYTTGGNVLSLAHAADAPESATDSLQVPRQNSIGQTTSGTSGNYTYYEIDLKDFARAIPMKLDYLLLDTCNTGAVEVAYELRNACHLIGFSPTEIMAAGFDYKSVSQRLLGGREPDVLGVLEDFFSQYDPEVSSTPYCTASLVDCDALEPLAEFCKDFFAGHREEMSHINPGNVQGYYRHGWHWFYDLEDIIVKAGAGTAELQNLKDALRQCVLYNEATPYFISIPIKTHCGMSMYLPCDGNATLDKYYSDLEWNKAVNLL